MDSSEFQQKNNMAKERRTYVKPIVERVQLILDESVLAAGCKTTSGGSNSGDVDPCVLGTNCVNEFSTGT